MRDERERARAQRETYETLKRARVEQDARIAAQGAPRVETVSAPIPVFALRV